MQQLFSLLSPPRETARVQMGCASVLDLTDSSYMHFAAMSVGLSVVFVDADVNAADRVDNIRQLTSWFKSSMSDYLGYITSSPYGTITCDDKWPELIMHKDEEAFKSTINAIFELNADDLASIVKHATRDWVMRLHSFMKSDCVVNKRLRNVIEAWEYQLSILGTQLSETLQYDDIEEHNHLLYLFFGSGFAPTIETISDKAHKARYPKKSGAYAASHLLLVPTSSPTDNFSKKHIAVLLPSQQMSLMPINCDGRLVSIRVRDGKKVYRIYDKHHKLSDPCMPFHDKRLFDDLLCIGAFLPFGDNEIFAAENYLAHETLPEAQGLQNDHESAPSVKSWTSSFSVLLRYMISNVNYDI